MRSDYIIWLGVGDLDPASNSKSYDSPAATFWQRELMQGLNKNNLSVATISHLVFPRWPKGPLKVPGGSLGSNKPAQNFSYSNVSYINFPIQRLKNKQLTTAYINQLKRTINRFGVPGLIIAYNGFPFTFEVAEYAKRQWGLKTILIVADQPPRGFFESLKQFEVSLCSLDGCVFLSWLYYNKLKHDVASMHFEGGVSSGVIAQENNPVAPRVSGKRIIMFCGSYGKHAGLDSLIRAASLLRSADTEFWIAGGCSLGNERIKQAPKNIVDLGFLSEYELDKRMQLADIFVSPNVTSFSPNNNNFPSKILLYLRYAKPIVCTWTEGLSPDYRDILCVAERDTPAAIAAKIDEVLAWDSMQHLECKMRLKAFADSHSWSKQSKRLIEWCFERIANPSEQIR